MRKIFAVLATMVVSGTALGALFWPQATATVDGTLTVPMSIAQQSDMWTFGWYEHVLDLDTLTNARTGERVPFFHSVPYHMIPGDSLIAGNFGIPEAPDRVCFWAVPIDVTVKPSGPGT